MEGNTPLLSAAGKGMLEVCNLLVEAGASVDFLKTEEAAHTSKKSSESGVLPSIGALHAALARSSFPRKKVNSSSSSPKVRQNLVAFLLKHGAPCHTLDERGEEKCKGS